MMTMSPATASTNSPLDLESPLAGVQDEDLGMRMPMAARSTAGRNLRVHDRRLQVVIGS